jgi:hypothetical protein
MIVKTGKHLLQSLSDNNWVSVFIVTQLISVAELFVYGVVG